MGSDRPRFGIHAALAALKAEAAEQQSKWRSDLQEAQQQQMNLTAQVAMMQDQAEALRIEHAEDACVV